MRTPPLRRRVTLSGMVVIAVILLAFDAAVYLSLRQRFEDSLSDLLAARAQVAREMGATVPSEHLAPRLAALAVPATVRTSDGRQFDAEPATPRLGSDQPPTPLLHPRISTRVTLTDGTQVEVFASRAGVESTLRRLLTTMATGTALALTLAYFLLRAVTARALRPLAQIAATAERTSAERTGERLRPERRDTDLGRMAVAFDDMLDRLEDALERSQQTEERSRRFLADAAHQLRTPLAGILGSVELLLGDTDRESRDRLLAHTVRETARMSRLLTDLLHMAQLDQGRPMLCTPTDLVTLCRGEVERAAALAPQLEVDLKVAQPPPTVELDPNEVSEAIANLLDNARRYAVSRVTLTVSRIDDGVAVKVTDDGPGVPDGEEERIFARFATLGHSGGSGLGLPIAREVARAHNGDLIYQDGSFVLTLPMPSQAEATGMETPAQADADPSGRRQSTTGDRT
ncbi:MAG: HAMP domain-containing histidine kinase [Actinomycetota bacterium]|nr:HAMP domain-containing histidine kinase [Actinomycetota bacterium]